MSQDEVRTPPARPNLFHAWWPVAIWIGLISFESTDMFSSKNTGDWLYSVVTRFVGNINLAEFLIFHFYLRKAGHVVGYGILALLWLRGWRATFAPVRAYSGKSQFFLTSFLALIGTMFVASMDEWHQSFIPSRTGTVQDVILDTLAGLVFLLIAYFWLPRRVTAQPT